MRAVSRYVTPEVGAHICQYQPDGAPDSHESEPTDDHEAPNRHGVGSERHPDAHLPRSAGGRVADHAVQSNRREQERESTGDAKDQRSHAGSR